MSFATNFKSDQPTRLQKQTKDDRAADRAWLELCRQVDARDGMICRACKCRLERTLARVPNRREHHHVIPRSLCGPDTLANVANICLGCHDARHVARTLEISGNANGKLRFKKGNKIWRG